MIRVLRPPIAWRALSQSALRAALLATATTLMVAGKLLYVTGARLQHCGESRGK